MLDDEPPPEYDDAGSDTPPQETEDPAYRKVRIFDHWVDSNRFDQAVDAGLEALADYPDSAYLHSRLGYAFFRLDRNKEAVHHLELARAADPDDAYPRSLLALIHGDSMISKFSKVEKEAFLALRLDPDNYNAWLTLAYSTVSYDEGFALSCCDRLIQLSPESAHPYLTKANVLCSFENTDTFRVQRMLQSALILEPDSADVHYTAAFFHLDLGKNSQIGHQHLESALLADPTHAGALELQDQQRQRKNWIIRILNLPKTMASLLFDFICKWADCGLIFFFTWPLALMAGVVCLWLIVCWLISLYPIRKLYEWLILKADHLKWSAPSWLAPLFRLTPPARWAIWISVSAALLSVIWWLLFNPEINGASGIYTVLAYTVVIGFIPVAIIFSVWEWWKRRKLAKLRQ